MITFELITEIDDVLFDRLYAESLSILESGSFPWQLWPDVITPEDRKNHINQAFKRVLSDGLGWLVKTDEHPVLLCVGTQEGDLIRWSLGLSGTNTSGSRSWLYEPSYATSRDAFWDSVGVKGWIMSQASKGKDIINHIQYKNQQGAIEANVEYVDSGIDGFTDIIITKPL